ncbi:MAG: thiolase family protein [Alphaproteobacteria bacterium]|nr:thiolase family protein [Alphaproteobacteria bacterium]
MLENVEIPYGAYWTTPFAKWQGALGHLNAIEFAAHVAKVELGRRKIAASVFDSAALGITTPQYKAFWGVPWFMGMIGAPSVTGPTIAQACATSVRCLQAGAADIATGQNVCSLVVAADKTSYTPHIYYPNPDGLGGVGQHENWLIDNMNRDPYAQVSMIETAENCAAKWQVTTAQQHDVVLRRYAQYQQATAAESAFQKRYMTLPFDVPDARYLKTKVTLSGDQGVFASSPEGLAKLKPLREGGSVTFGGQTHPADGNAAVVMTTPDRARDMASDPAIRVRVLGFGSGRVDEAFMPAATVPAAKCALEHAGKTIADIDAVKTHNPFAVNDVVFARETGFPLNDMNNYGCSLIWGHPNAPTGLRATIELIEELVIRGGGVGLFTGCAAGDSGMAVVIEVGDR